MLTFAFQVMLYSVMLGDLDSQAANDLGILLYVKTGEMIAVPAAQMDKRGMIYTNISNNLQ